MDIQIQITFHKLFTIFLISIVENQIVSKNFLNFSKFFRVGKYFKNQGLGKYFLISYHLQFSIINQSIDRRSSPPQRTKDFQAKNRGKKIIFSGTLKELYGVP